jgi:hypothetical protein
MQRELTLMSPGMPPTTRVACRMSRATATTIGAQVVMALNTMRIGNRAGSGGVTRQVSRQLKPLGVSRS